jgi:hypothetical protein
MENNNQVVDFLAVALRREANNRRSQNWKARNLEKLREKSRLYRTENLERVRKISRESARRQRAKNPEKTRQAVREAARRRYNTDPETFLKKRKERELRRNYNIGIKEYDNILRAQNGVCAICKQPPNGKALAVDHDHQCCPGEKVCGQCVRGLLCNTCNVALGSFRDSPAILYAGIEYILKYADQ